MKHPSAHSALKLHSLFLYPMHLRLMHHQTCLLSVHPLFFYIFRSNNLTVSLLAHFSSRTPLRIYMSLLTLPSIQVFHTLIHPLLPSSPSLVNLSTSVQCIRDSLIPLFLYTSHSSSSVYSLPPSLHHHFHQSIILHSHHMPYSV